MEFLNSTELELNKAGYLISKKSSKPVTHASFVKQQENAEYIVKLAEAIKDKNFTCGKVDNLEQIKLDVLMSINNNTKKYVTEPNKPTSKVNEELVQFALDFNNYEDKKLLTEKINQLMNQFNKIDDVEKVGEYFSEGLVKLNKIYTISEILEAVQINVDKIK